MRISDWSSDVCSSDLRKGSSEGRRLEVGIVLQHGQIVLYLLDLVPVLRWVLLQFREVFGELELCRHGIVVAGAPLVAGDRIARADEEVVAGFVGVSLPVARRQSAAAFRLMVGRSAERRVGKECVSTCRSRWSPYH